MGRPLPAGADWGTPGLPQLPKNFGRVSCTAVLSATRSPAARRQPLPAGHLETEIQQQKDKKKEDLTCEGKAPVPGQAPLQQNHTLGTGEGWGGERRPTGEEM